MACKSCGGTSFADEDYNRVCERCGIVEDKVLLVADTNPLASTFMRCDNPDKSVAYRNFEDLYKFCTQSVNAPSAISNAGLQMLPQLWQDIKNKSVKTKKMYIFALLYLLYRQHQLDVTFKKFFNGSRLHKKNQSMSSIVRYVASTFNLNMPGATFETITSNNIRQLAKIVFKTPVKQLEGEIILLAGKIATVIHEKKWVDSTSKDYTSVISIIATVLAAQHLLSKMTHRKTKQGRHASFRIDTIDYQQLSGQMCVHVAIIRQNLHLVQKKLFNLAQKLPWTAQLIGKPYDVALVLDDILKNVDIDLEGEDYPDIPPLIPTDLKLKLMEAIVCNFSEQSCNSPSVIDKKKILEVLHSSSGLNGAAVHNVDDELKVDGFTFKVHYLELLKDLLSSGCTATELLNENYIALVKKYLNLKKTYYDEGLEDFTEEEMSLYFKNPNLISNLNEKTNI